MKKILMSLIWGALLLHAQDTITATATPSTVKLGQPTTVTLTLSGSAPVAALQWTVGFPNGWSASTTAPAAITAIPKQIVTGTATSVEYGNNILPIPNGPVATLAVNIPASSTTGAQTLSLTNLLGSTAAGLPVTITGVNVTITVQNQYDITGDGAVTVADITAMAAQVASGTCTADPAGNGQCNVLEIIAEVLGWQAAGSKP